MARTSKYRQAYSSAASQSRWRVGLYIRISREDGDRIESESIASQRALLQRFAEERPDMQLFDCYTDDGFSGTDFNRPAFQRMIKDAANKKINCIIVKDLSRFGRNYVEAGKYLETVFPLFGVRFIAVNDQIDSVASPASVNNIIVPFKNIINDEYCRDISIKVRSALDIRRRQGKFIGSFAPYGYRKDEADRSKLVIDDGAAQIVRFIFKEFLSGNGISAIVRSLNARSVPNPTAYKRSKGLSCNRNSENSSLWVDSTVRRILLNQLYIGNLVQKKNEVISYKIHKTRAVDSASRIVVENTHTPIISKADFAKAQQLLSRDTRTSPKTGKLSVFAGLVKCADCGRAMQKRTVVQPNKAYSYYVCSTYKKLDKTACTKHAVRIDVLEAAVLEVINRYIAFAVNYQSLSQRVRLARSGGGTASRITAELNARRGELLKAQRLLTEIYPDFKSGILSREQYFALKERYENMCSSTQAAIEALQRELNGLKDEEEGINEFIACFGKYAQLKQLTREAAVELIDNIYIREGGKIDLHLKFRDVYLAAEHSLTNADNNAEKAALRK